ncbi:hypothetical protein [Actinoplanes sp. L3-i22]|uniref:hypothetical protein n=1 Tax=Actinoplanes sp. L3-i22 TaxID=2836373 RepID=UPI001C794BAF|nr:hypothetical protein [Actinoplanes sp. L3-i22]BCY12919.1 hypothetical protein L3i22_080070 [Actinoplanes sp. L3-i22]
MSARNLALLIAAAGLALGAAACDSTGDTAGAAPAPGATSARPTAGATPAATATTTATTRAACPVTSDDLQPAVRKKAGDNTAEIAFEKIVCYRDYAAATTPENKISDEEYYVFKYTAGDWSVLSSGTGDICPGVPADVTKHFRAAHYGACD